MWIYEKKLQYPVKIKTPNPRLAQIIISQLGGPDGEIGASMRYLNQRYSMPEKQVAGLLTDIGTEELAHVEMVTAILYQLTRNLPADEIAASPIASSTTVSRCAKSAAFFSTALNFLRPPFPRCLRRPLCKPRPISP